MRKPILAAAVALLFVPWSGVPASAATEDPLVYHSLSPCVLFDTRPGFGGSGIMAAGETRNFHVVGSTSDFASQGGTAGGCGIPGFAGSLPQTQSVFINIQAITPAGGGTLKAWPADEAEPVQGGVVTYQMLSPNLNIANALALGVRQDSEGNDISIRANGASVHVRGVALGYFDLGEGFFWALGGNAGTTPGTHFLGTTDNKRLDLRVNNRRALRIVPGSSPNLIGGWAGNSVTAGVVGAAIGGGGCTGCEGPGDFPNVVTDDFGTVGGGIDNQAGDGANTTTDRRFATVGGGFSNTANGAFATVGGGFGNTSSATRATVAGGDFNTASGVQATVGGGVGNTASGDQATLGGGASNTVDDSQATVAGGFGNTATGAVATVGGGSTNTASEFGATVGGGGSNAASAANAAVGGGSFNSASGEQATVGGGLSNIASGTRAAVGGGSFNNASGEEAAVAGGFGNSASGRRALAGGEDNTASGYAATVPGGSQNNAAGDYSLAAGQLAKIDAAHDGAFLFGDQTNADFNSAAANEFAVRASGGFRFRTNSTLTTGCNLPAGTSAFDCTSDRSVKTAFAPVDPRGVLRAVSAVPISTWVFKGDPSARHIGPMAQDFHRAFGLGRDERTIATVDADGVALAAIQGLNQELQSKDARLAELETRLAAVETGTTSPSEGVPAKGWWGLSAGLALAGVGLGRRWGRTARQN